MTMKKWKAAVIGCGSIARHRHLVEYAAHPEVEITAVCDIVEERANEMAEKYNAKAYTNYEELLAKEDIDVVSVCLPNVLHAPVSIAALNAGCHVLCEKPMATSREEAEQMIEASHKNNKKLMIAHNQRFVPSHAKAKKLIETGEIGRVFSFRTTFGHGGPENWSVEGRDSWFFKKEKAFIGAMGDLGIHKADLLRYLLGEDFDEVASFVETTREGIDVDDNAVFILKTASGVVGTLAASWSYTAAEDNSTIIYGEKAILRLEDNPDYSLVVQYKNGEVVRYALGKIQSNESGGQKNTHVIENFIQSIKNDTEPPISGEEGKKSLEVILAAIEANASKRTVKVQA